MTDNLYTTTGRNVSRSMAGEDLACAECGNPIVYPALFTRGARGDPSLPVCSQCRPFDILVHDLRACRYHAVSRMNKHIITVISGSEESARRRVNEQLSIPARQRWLAEWRAGGCRLAWEETQVLCFYLSSKGEVLEATCTIPDLLDANPDFPVDDRDAILALLPGNEYFLNCGSGGNNRLVATRVERLTTIGDQEEQ